MIICGDALTELRKLPDESIHMCVTSPPYWGLRDYGIEGQLGLELTPETYVIKLVEIFREVKRILKRDGTLWLVLGDSYSGSCCGSNDYRPEGSSISKNNKKYKGQRPGLSIGLKAKDLVGIPWRVAFALQADGWFLRSDIIWAKSNPMPESVTDRPTKSHEYVFLLSKSARYYFDQEAIAEPITDSTIQRLNQSNLENQVGSNRVPFKTNGPMKAVGKIRLRPNGAATYEKFGFDTGCGVREDGKRNCRSVWTITTKPMPKIFGAEHFATFPPEIPERCIKAGSPVGGVVLDPFFGAGTTGMVALNLGRDFIGIELNPKYCEMAKKRIYGELQELQI